MLTLINTNRMKPPVGPVGIDYVAAAARDAGIAADVLDLCLAEADASDDAAGAEADATADDAIDAAMRTHFASRRPELVGISFRNADDCFWPSAESFVPALKRTVARLRSLTDAPVVLGGVGLSIFAERLLAETGADFAVRGDGEQAIVALVEELRRARPRLDRVGGLIRRADGAGGGLVANAPAWPAELRVPPSRGAVDNAAYFRLGGQGGFETKRGCPRRCIYCADPLAKGPVTRARRPAEVADEIAALLAQGVDVLHTCDSEFNVPPEHAAAVCDEISRRGLGTRVRWYAYAAVVPFDDALAAAMRRAGCAGVNFTADSTAEAMLRRYAQPHRAPDLAAAVDACRRHGIAVMIDLLLGGPGETEQTLAETISTLKRIAPDAAGAALGMRLYPDTPAMGLLAAEGPLEANAGLRRRYSGPVDLVHPTFYISPALGPQPARLVKDLIAGDERFFAPMDDGPSAAATDHNYNANDALVAAIAGGARGAYWDILRKLPRP